MFATEIFPVRPQNVQRGGKLPSQLFGATNQATNEATVAFCMLGYCFENPHLRFTDAKSKSCI